MKARLLVTAAFGVASALASAADQVENFREGSNGKGVYTGGNATYTVPVGEFSPALGTGQAAGFTKLPGTLNVTFPTKNFFPNLNTTHQMVWTGAKVNASQIDFTVSAPTMIGQQVPMQFGNYSGTMTVQSVTGTLRFNLAQLGTPETDQFNNNVRRTIVMTIDGDGSESSFAISGNFQHQNGSTYPSTVTYNPITMRLVSGPAPRTLASCAVNPSTIEGGQSTTGTVTLQTPAPTGGLTVALSDESSSITTPAFVDIVGGAASATFAVNTTPVSGAATRQVLATLFGITRQASLTIVPSRRVNYVQLTPAVVVGGSSSDGIVNISYSPPGGATVALSTNSSVIGVPTSVFIPAGQVNGPFTATTQNVGATATRLVTASYNGTTRSTTLTIKPNPILKSITISPNSVKGGTSTNGTVTVDRAAVDSGASVTLSSNSSAVVVPASVNVAAGATSVNFTITTKPVTATYNRQVTATRNGVTRAAIITITP